MRRKRMMKQLGAFLLSAVLGLTPAVQVAAAVPEQDVSLKTEAESTETTDASATQTMTEGAAAVPDTGSESPKTEEPVVPEPETAQKTAQGTTETTAEDMTEGTTATTPEPTSEPEKQTGSTDEDAEATSGQEAVEKQGSVASQAGLQAAYASGAVSTPEDAASGQETPTAEGITPQSGYDINKPVAEDVWLPQAGQTLNTSDTLEIRVKAYDADSGIDSVSVWLDFLSEDESSWSVSVSLEFDEEQQNYVGWYPLDHVIVSEGCISSLNITDKAGNYLSLDRWEEGGLLDQEDCRFFIQRDELTVDSQVTALNFEKQGAYVNVGEQLDVSLQLSSPLDEEISYSFYMDWKNQETGNWISLYLYRQEDGTYTGSYVTDHYMDNGKWVLNDIYVEIQGEHFPLRTDAIGSLSDYWFELQGSEGVEQPESPIQEVSLDPCGQMVEPGDTVSLKVKVEGNDQKWYEYATAHFNSAADISNGYFTMELTYQPDSQMFEGSYTVTDDTYPTEWYLESIYLCNSEGYDGYYYRTDEILNADYYFFVQNDNTFTNPSFDVEVYFQAQDSNGSFSNVAYFQKTDILRRTTFEEAGITAPEAPDYVPEGLKFLGWVDENGNPFDSKEQLLYGTYRSYYALYDQRVFSFYYNYYDKEMGNQYKQLILYTPIDVTYGELKSLLQEKLPDVSDRIPEEMGFKGWNIPFTYPDEEKVPFSSNSFTVFAAYTQNIVELTYEFLNSDGTKMIQEKDTVLVEVGTTIGELRQLIDQHPYPEEGNQELGFESWELAGGWEDDAILGGTNRFTVHANYEKIIVSTEFSYINEDDNTVIDYEKIFQFDKGSTYADLIEEISDVEAPEDISKELKFKGWNVSLYESEDTPLRTGQSFFASADYENACLKIDYKYVSENGSYESKRVEKLVPSGTTIKEVKSQIADFELPETYGNLKFEEWDFPMWVTDDTEITEIYFLSMTANYGDPVVETLFTYVKENTGIVQQSEAIIQVKEGSTINQTLEAVVAQAPTDVYDSENVQWTPGGVYDLNSPVGNMSFLALEATYENRVNLSVEMSYISEDGKKLRENRLWIVEKGTTYETIRETLAKQPLPEQFPDIKFQGWKIYGKETGEIQEHEEMMTMTAQYDKCVILYIVDNRIADYDNVWEIPSEMDWDVEHVEVMEPGELLQLPTQMDGYKDIFWLNGDPEEPVQVMTHLTYYGYGVKDGTDPEEPTEPEEPTDPEEPTEPEEPADPEEPTDPTDPEEPTDPGVPETPENPQEPQKPQDTSKLPEEIETVIVEEIVEAQPGQTVTVDMQDATVVSKNMLESAQGKDVNIQLNLGGYSWTINGRDILASDLSDINLEVKQDTGAIPNRVVQAMAGDNPVRQLSLTHNGNFGFRATLTINVGSENSGKYGNLYYYDSTGKMVFMNAGMIDGNGNVTLSFSHASEYLLVVNERVMSDADVPADLKGETGTSGGSTTTPVSTENTSADNATATKTNTDVANTADATPTAWAGTFLLAALVLAGIGVHQKRRSA